MSGMHSPQASGSAPSPRRGWYRAALVATIGLILFVVALLPLAIQSMRDVLGRGPDPMYDHLTGAVVTPAILAAAEAEATYLNLGLIDLAEATGQLIVAVSGNRNCGEACAALELTFVALDDDADQRRGLLPSVTLTLAPDDRVFSHAVELPVRGQPSLYPFDQYQLWLGVAGATIEPGGARVELRPESVAQHAVVTVHNRIPEMIMPAPRPIAPETLRSATDPFGFLAVQGLTFARPAYLKVLAIVLVLLVAASAALALVTRSLDELVLGTGGIILGVWGVRSILMPQSLSTVTAIDLALSWVILLLLLGLAVRAALHFHRHSDLPWARPRRTP